jgi:hypothetical protein
LTSIYSTVFFDGDVTAVGSVAHLWTVPAGFVDVIRTLTGYCGAGSSTQAWLGTNGHYWRTWLLTGSYDLLEFEGHQAVPAGETIDWLQTHSPCALRLSGYRLSA